MSCTRSWSGDERRWTNSTTMSPSIDPRDAGERPRWPYLVSPNGASDVRRRVAGHDLLHDRLDPVNGAVEDPSTALTHADRLAR